MPAAFSDVQKDTSREYSLLTHTPSPFPQHKGQLMRFGAVKIGTAYVNYHLMPLCTNAALAKSLSPALKKRMQGNPASTSRQHPTKCSLPILKN